VVLLALSEAGQRAAGLAVAAAATLAVWCALFAVLALASRPRLPDAAPAAQDLPGREPPAVVGFLVNRWELGRETVPATLLDLATKGAVALEQVAPDRFVCRVRQTVPAGLTAYEEQVLDHVRGLASGGVVPCEALTTGPEAQSKGWWDRFQKAVVADARRRGLSRGRWSKGALVALGVVAVAPAVLAAAALVLAPTKSSTSSSSSSSSSSSDDNPVGAFIGVAVLGWGALMAVPYSLRAERDTPEGRAAAAKWLGLRRYLAEDQAFDQAPPAAVAIWDRYLAYGAAMGVAAGAVRALPLGSESDRSAWSSYGGRWHVVRVRYPDKFPPGWGKHPLAAFAQALAILGGVALVGAEIGPSLFGAVGDVLRSSRAGGWHGYALVGAGVFVLVVAVAVLYVVRTALLLALAAPDLFSRSHVEGIVIRMRAGYLAVDDGEHARVRAWRVEPAKLAGVARGTIVRATVSPRLGHVFQLEAVDHRPQEAGFRGAKAAVAMAGALAAAPGSVSAAAMPGLDLAAVEAQTGVHLQVFTGAAAPPVPGAEQAFLLTDGGAGKVFVIVSGDHHGDGTPDISRFLRWTVGRGSTPVDGVGDEATWGARRSVLTARRGDTRVTVVAALEALPTERRLDVARALAASLLDQVHPT
jgi:hypothetical protein